MLFIQKETLLKLLFLDDAARTLQLITAALSLISFFSETNLLAPENTKTFWLNSDKKTPRTLCCNLDSQSTNNARASWICKLPQMAAHPSLREPLQVTPGEGYTLLCNRHLQMLSGTFSLWLPPFDFFFFPYCTQLWDYMLKSNHGIKRTVILIESWWQIYIQPRVTSSPTASGGWHGETSALTHSVSSLAGWANVYSG